ncbi:hypothetical protein [Brevundimonas sp.]|uniref:hypothetical protein n=1 Tax=Brevundimonas sp. TaxID=1871086 RepID=UPI0025BC86EC|nr:hypothetical protein [Brevundimonas sp.]
MGVIDRALATAPIRAEGRSSVVFIPPQHRPDAYGSRSRLRHRAGRLSFPAMTMFIRTTAFGFPLA